MSAIICPVCGSEKRETKDDFLNELYRKYKNLEREADEIHVSRMMPPPAWANPSMCSQCIEMALHRILVAFESENVDKGV